MDVSLDQDEDDRLLADCLDTYELTAPNVVNSTQADNSCSITNQSSACSGNPAQDKGLKQHTNCHANINTSDSPLQDCACTCISNLTKKIQKQNVTQVKNNLHEQSFEKDISSGSQNYNEKEQFNTNNTLCRVITSGIPVNSQTCGLDATKNILDPVIATNHTECHSKEIDGSSEACNPIIETNHTPCRTKEIGEIIPVNSDTTKNILDPVITINHTQFYTRESDATIPVNSDTCGPGSTDMLDPVMTTNPTLCDTNKGEASKHGTLQQVFRPRYFCVSDFIKQEWCEQQVLYSFTVPTVVVENPVMTAGSSVHLARELTVHDTVQVEITSKEDSWSVKVLNLLTCVQGFLNGVNKAREIPIFGVPYGGHDFFVGVIDELRFDPETYTIELRELKTRSFRSLPKTSQQNQNKLQVRIYKKLFDDMVQGQLNKDAIGTHILLDLNRPLSEAILEHVDKLYLTSKTLGDLLDTVLLKMQCLTCISALSIEYVLQSTSESLYIIPCDFDDSLLRTKLEDYSDFWHGKR